MLSRSVVGKGFGAESLKISPTQKVQKCSQNSFEENMFEEGAWGGAYTRHLIHAS